LEKEELVSKWWTGNSLFYSKSDRCVSIKIRSHKGAEGFPGYSLSVIEGEVSALEGVAIVPVLAFLYHYFMEMFEILKLAASQATNHIKVVTKALEESNKRSHPPCMSSDSFFFPPLPSPLS
jgi:hypothetical protein